MTYHVSNVILSLTMFVFVDKECVYIISINAMKEVEKRGGNLVFLTKKKVSLFIQRLGFNFFPLISFLGFVQPLSKAPCHASQLFVCATR